MHFVVSPVLHAYVYGPSGPQMSTFSPGHTCVSGAEIEQIGFSSWMIVTEQVLSLLQPVSVFVITSVYVPAPTVMHFVVSPVLHAYVYGPSGPQIVTVSPGHTCVSLAVIAHTGFWSSLIVTEQVLSLT